MSTCRFAFIAMILATATLAAAETAGDQTQTVELGWCSVELPRSVKVKEPATFKVTLREVPDNAAKINFDLHWFDSTGVSKGMNKSGGAKLVELNQAIEWVITPSAKEDITKILPVFYLSSEGTWSTKVTSKAAKLPTIEVVAP